MHQREDICPEKNFPRLRSAFIDASGGMSVLVLHSSVLSVPSVVKSFPSLRTWRIFDDENVKPQIEFTAASLIIEISTATLNDITWRLNVVQAPLPSPDR